MIDFKTAFSSAMSIFKNEGREKILIVGETGTTWIFRGADMPDDDRNLPLFVDRETGKIHVYDFSIDDRNQMEKAKVVYNAKE